MGMCDVRCAARGMADRSQTICTKTEACMSAVMQRTMVISHIYSHNIYVIRNQKNVNGFAACCLPA